MDKRKLLLVDDEEESLYAVRMALDQDDYQILRDKTTGAAMARLKKAKAIDLILLDVMIDQRSGLDLLDKMAEMNVTVPVVILSALNDARTAAAAFKKGASGYVVKPFHASDLVTAVKTALEKGRRGNNGSVIGCDKTQAG